VRVFAITQKRRDVKTGGSRKKGKLVEGKAPLLSQVVLTTSREFGYRGGWGLKQRGKKKNREAANLLT